MKIGIVGAHSAGKTTSLAFLTYKLKKADRTVGFLPEVARVCPFPLNEAGGVETQWWILSEQIRQELRLQKFYKNIVTDRTVWDSVAYARHLREKGRMSDDNWSVIHGTALMWAGHHPYDVIIFLEPLQLLKKDPQRSKKEAYQQAIDHQLREVLKTYEPRKNIYFIDTAPKEERCLDVWHLVRELLGEID